MAAWSALLVANLNSFSWLGRIRLFDDAPVGGDSRDRDLLQFRGLVELTAGSLRDAGGPMVVHVDGSWGRGKTSFCRMLDRALMPGDTRSSHASESGRINTGWYVASDEQVEARDAVLATVARAIADGDAEETARIVRMWGTQADGGGLGGADFESFRSWVGRELGWSRSLRGEEHELPLPWTETAGPPPEGSAPAPSTWKLPLRDPPRRGVVVFVDDLDRCRPDRVLEVFDALRRFVACPGVMFVVAADREVIRRAFVTTVEQLGAAGTRHADEAMEKYIRHRVELPTMANFSGHLTTQLRELQSRLLGGDLSLLRGPGLELEDGVAVLLAQSFRRSLNLRRLKRLLNALAVDLARAADALNLGPDELGPGAYEEREEGLWRPSSLRAVSSLRLVSADPRRTQDYPQFFLSRLIAETARFMWPELVVGLEPDGRELQERVDCLVAIGRELGRWPEKKLERIMGELVPAPDDRVATSLVGRREFCDFLGRLQRSLEDAAGATDDGAVLSLPGSPVEEDDDAPFVPDYVEPESAAPRPVTRSGETSRRGEPSPGRPGPDDADAASRQDEHALRRLHAEILKRTDLVSEAVDVGTLLDVLDRVDLLLSTRLGHHSFRPQAVIDGVRAIVGHARREDLARAADGLLRVSTAVQHWGRFEDAAQLASAAWNASDPDGALRVWSTALLLEDLLLADDFDNDTEPLPLELSPPENTRLKQGIALLRATRDLSHRVGEDCHVHYSMAALGFVRAAEHRRLGLPGDISKLGDRLLRQYLEVFEQAPSVKSATWAVRAMASADEPIPAVLEKIYRLALDSSEPELVRRLADVYLAEGSAGGEQRADELYSMLRGTTGWTPGVLHNLATLKLAQGAKVEAGRCWELAYRAGYRDSRMLRAFLQFLRGLGLSDEAVIVAQKRPLPEHWHPFGEDPPQSEVHVPPPMLLP